MLDTRWNDWLSRLRGNAPNMVSLGLAALIAVELARMAAMLLVSPVKSPQPTIAQAPPTRPHLTADIQTVVARHLMGIAAADPATRNPDTAPPSTANLILAGTIATQDPKRGIAIISDGGPAKVYSIGDNVGGASLYSVYMRHVILDRAGALETLQLPVLVGGGAGTAPPRAPVVNRHVGADPRTVAAVENIRHMVQQDPGLLDQVMRTVPLYDSQGGKLRGFRAYPGRNRVIFGKLGLRPGDLVTAINGQPLDDPQHSQEVFNTIQSSDHVEVTIERGGQKQDISLNIAQVATEATKDLEGDSGTAGSGAAASTPQNGP